MQVDTRGATYLAGIQAAICDPRAQVGVLELDGLRVTQGLARLLHVPGLAGGLGDNFHAGLLYDVGACATCIGRDQT